MWLFVTYENPTGNGCTFFSKFFLSKFFRQWCIGYLRCVRRRRGTGWGKDPNTEIPESNDPTELAAFVVPCCPHNNAGLVGAGTSALRVEWLR